MLEPEQILSELSDDVRTMVETGPLLETVANRVSDTLHVPRVAILLNSDGVLEPVEGLTVSMLGVMGRLARADDLTLRQTDIAGAMGLSFSRVSRLIDTLEARGLVERRPCPSDGRAVNVTLTTAGQALTRRAQDAVFAFVGERFFASLAAPEIATLADVFTRLIGRLDGAGAVLEDCG